MSRHSFTEVPTIRVVLKPPLKYHLVLFRFETLVLSRGLRKHGLPTVTPFPVSTSPDTLPVVTPERTEVTGMERSHWVKSSVDS